MKTILFSTLFLFLFVLGSFAQSPINDWGTVEALRSKTNIIVETKAGNTLKGNVVWVDASSLSLRIDGRSVTLSRGDVSRVYLTRRRSVLKRMFWGAAAGAGIGFAVGGAIAVATKGKGLEAAAGFLYGIPAGAAIGAATTGRKRDELIYNSP